MSKAKYKIFLGKKVKKKKTKKPKKKYPGSWKKTMAKGKKMRT